MSRTLLLVAAVVLVAGCGGGGKRAKSDTATATAPASSSAETSTSTSTSGAVTTHGRFRYPAVLIRNYMSSCVRSAEREAQRTGQPRSNYRAYCACTLDKLSNNVSTRDFAEIGLSNGRIPPRIKRFMANAVADCADKL